MASRVAVLESVAVLSKEDRKELWDALKETGALVNKTAVEQAGLVQQIKEYISATGKTANDVQALDSRMTRMESERLGAGRVWSLVYAFGGGSLVLIFTGLKDALFHWIR